MSDNAINKVELHCGVTRRQAIFVPESASLIVMKITNVVISIVSSSSI
jgi:hypothetical protein